MGKATPWETVGTLSIDSGCCAFADATLLDDIPEIPVTSEQVLDLTPSGFPLIVCSTQEDLDMPVEARRKPPSARMEFVNDVATLAGAWEQVGKLPISSGRGLACDPYRVKDPFYRVEFPIAPGTYVAEIFRAEDGNVLGLRLVRDERDTSVEPEPGRSRTLLLWDQKATDEEVVDIVMEALGYGKSADEEVVERVHGEPGDESGRL